MHPAARTATARHRPRRPLAAASLALAAALWAALAAPTAAAAGTPSGGGAAALDLSRHAGKVVYVDFWASWCTPCRAAFPWMNALQAELGDEGLVFVGVNTGDDPESAARFLDEVPAEFEIVFDTDGSIARAYGMQGMPTAYIHGRDGELVATHQGFNEAAAARYAEELRAFVRSGR